MVLAANKGLYNKLTGKHTDLEKASIDLTCEDTTEESDSSRTTNPESLEPLHKKPRLKCDTQGGQTFSGFSVGCCIERRLSVTNLSSENNFGDVSTEYFSCH